MQRETRSGAELVEFALKLLRDESACFEDRKYAHNWLSDRGFGKPVQAVEIAAVNDDNGQPLVDLTALPLERRRELLSALDQSEALAAEPIPEPDGDVIDVQ